jgi:hypothetical protein
MVEQNSELQKAKSSLCRHYRVVRIAAEPGFDAACAISYRASPKCHSALTSDCRGYEPGYVTRDMMETTRAAIRKRPGSGRPSGNAGGGRKSPRGNTGKGLKKKTRFSWVPRCAPAGKRKIGN